METKHNLREQTIEKVQDLIQINIDSQKGFCEVADKVKDKQLAALFKQLGDERRTNTTELQQIVNFNGEKPQHDGSFAATVHRAWIDVRAAINGGDASVILNEAERGEDAIKEMYEDVLKETAGSAVNDVLTRQYAKVKAGHDKVRDLRNAYAHA
ncbi:PA2169 family four-helix-bundle protein [Lacipirellula sp.]|uniref:PA2169 family four-helix-bundle protein n=1 Tax=Lacipirellula sp. TaxID=2691419 RepID=UPI003D0BE046